MSQNETPIITQATEFATEKNLDTKRTIELFVRLKSPFSTILENELSIFKSAIFELGIEKAFDLFENENIDLLLHKCHSVLHWNSESSLLYSFEELVEHLKSYIEYLKDLEDDLVEYGFPSTFFSNSVFFDHLLIFNYYTHLPIRIPWEIKVSKDFYNFDYVTVERQPNRMYAHQKRFIDKIWRCNPNQRPTGFIIDKDGILGEVLDGSILDNIKLCSYKDSGLIDGISEEDDSYLENGLRERFFKLKINVLNTISSHIKNHYCPDIIKKG